MQDKLLHFVGRSDWSDEKVRLEAAQYVSAALSARREDVTTWIVDDTGFLKQGTHSVGVQRQYTGAAGKIANCQIGVSLAIATPTEHAPIDFELYLPQAWIDDPERRKEARIPPSAEFETKVALALKMITRAVDAGLPGKIVLGDSAYGESSHFRQTVRNLGFDFAVGIRCGTKVRRIGAHGHLGTAMSVSKLAKRIPHRERRKVTWREGTNAELTGQFHFCRVKPTHDDGTAIEDREPLWLVIEWPLGSDHPAKFYLTSLPRRMSHRKIARHIKERWRTEQMYLELKSELGLDHFEGRSFPGWNHHVSVVICSYAFVVAERVRAFPPAARRADQDESLDIAA
jgi:SRSO17 transposase